MRRQIGIMALVGAGAFALGGMAAFANGEAAPTGAGALEQPDIATSVITVTATTPLAADNSDFLLSSAGQTPETPGFGYSYVVYFPVGSTTLTEPARDAVAAIADEVTGLELSRVTLSNDVSPVAAGPATGPVARTQVVRDALVELGVPARWIGENTDAPEAIGPISMAPTDI